MRPSMVMALVALSALGYDLASAEETAVAKDRAVIDAQVPNQAHEWDDSATTSSVSCGRSNRGSLYGAKALSRVGFGYEIPGPWWQRGYRYGTDQLIALLERATSTVATAYPGAVVGVGDISQPGGGAIPGHRSHQSGRDVDFIYYALDIDGRPLPPDQHMAYYGASGRSTYARSPSFERNISERYFDLARNWALVRALVTDAEVEVQHIFVSQRVRRWLLKYARRIGEPTELLDHAARILRHPHGVGSHNDHMHVRIKCSDSDAALGRCRDTSARPPKRGRRWYSRVSCPALSMSMP